MTEGGMGTHVLARSLSYGHRRTALGTGGGGGLLVPGSE